MRGIDLSPSQWRIVYLDLATELEGILFEKIVSIPDRRKQRNIYIS
jgi:hypothetical protein